MQVFLWVILKENPYMQRNTQLITNSSKNLNKQRPTTKFDCKKSKQEIAVLDMKTYIDDNKNIQTTVYRKEKGRQSFLHSKSEHSLFLKQGIPYSQALRLKCIFSTFTELLKEAENLM